MFGSKMMSSGGKPTSIDEDPVGALADADFVLVGRGLALLVEGHDHGGRAILQHRGAFSRNFSSPSFSEIEFTMPLPLKALQPGLDDLPLRGVDHERNLGDFRLAGQQLQEARHRRDAVDHAFVHADVEDVGAILDLLPGDADRLFVFALP